MLCATISEGDGGLSNGSKPRGTLCIVSKTTRATLIFIIILFRCFVVILFRLVYISGSIRPPVDPGGNRRAYVDQPIAKMERKFFHIVFNQQKIGKALSLGQ